MGWKGENNRTQKERKQFEELSGMGKGKIRNEELWKGEDCVFPTCPFKIPSGCTGEKRIPKEGRIIIRSKENPNSFIKIKWPRKHQWHNYHRTPWCHDWPSIRSKKYNVPSTVTCAQTCKTNPILTNVLAKNWTVSCSKNDSIHFCWNNQSILASLKEMEFHYVSFQ